MGWFGTTEPQKTDQATTTSQTEKTSNPQTEQKDTNMNGQTPVSQATEATDGEVLTTQHTKCIGESHKRSVPRHKSNKEIKDLLEANKARLDALDKNPSKLEAAQKNQKAFDEQSAAGSYWMTSDSKEAKVWRQRQSNMEHMRQLDDRIKDKDKTIVKLRKEQFERDNVNVVPGRGGKPSFFDPRAELAKKMQQEFDETPVGPQVRWGHK